MIAAVDAMLKSASVTFVGYQSLDGQFTASIAGDVSSVRHAIDVGVRRAQQVGEVVASRVISAVEEEMVQKIPIVSEKTVSLRLGKPEEGLSRRLLGQGS
jgi:microcompartment protein CcmL/EutN